MLQASAADRTVDDVPVHEATTLDVSFKLAACLKEDVRADAADRPLWSLFKQKVADARADVKEVVREEGVFDSFYRRKSQSVDAMRLGKVLELAEVKQEESSSDYRERVLQEISRPSPVSHETRKGWHMSFRSKRRSSIAASPSMVQALRTRTNEEEKLLSEATQKQAIVLAQGRVSSLPAERHQDRRRRRLSAGEEAFGASAALLDIWAESGTHDDRFRPENNAAGFVAPTAVEVVGDLLAHAEKERVECLLDRYRADQAEYVPTHPVGPTCLFRGATAASESHVDDDDDVHQSAQSLYGMGGGSSRPRSRTPPLSARRLCYTRPLHGRSISKAASACLAPPTALFSPPATAREARRSSSATDGQSPPRFGIARLLDTEASQARREQTRAFYKSYFGRFTQSGSKQWPM